MSRYPQADNRPNANECDDLSRHIMVLMGGKGGGVRGVLGAPGVQGVTSCRHSCLFGTAFPAKPEMFLPA